jgi:hypothetical protein
VLTGDRKGTWSLHVTRNRRLTFRIEGDEIIELNVEDYGARNTSVVGICVARRAGI